MRTESLFSTIIIFYNAERLFSGINRQRLESNRRELGVVAR
jgi:hypothetical protein